MGPIFHCFCFRDVNFTISIWGMWFSLFVNMCLNFCLNTIPLLRLLHSSSHTVSCFHPHHTLLPPTHSHRHLYQKDGARTHYVPIVPTSCYTYFIGKNCYDTLPCKNCYLPCKNFTRRLSADDDDSEVMHASYVTRSDDNADAHFLPPWPMTSHSSSSPVVLPILLLAIVALVGRHDDGGGTGIVASSFVLVPPVLLPDPRRRAAVHGTG